MDRLTIIVAMTGMGFTVLGVAMWRLHVLLEAAEARIIQLELDVLDLWPPARLSPVMAKLEDPAEWGC